MPNKNSKILDDLILKNGIYLVIILLFIIALCMYDSKWIIPSIFIYFLLIVYTIRTNSKKKSEIVNHIREITTDVNIATKKNLINSPIPLIIVETDGNIIWKSQKFIDEFKNIDISTYLMPLIKEIKLDLEKNDENKEIYIYYVHDSILDLFLTPRFPFIGFYPINRTGEEFWLLFEYNSLVKTSKRNDLKLN